MNFWPDIYALGETYRTRRILLEQVTLWRNAIAHQDFDRLTEEPTIKGTKADLTTVQFWRSSLDQLAGGMDRLLHAQIHRITGEEPW